MPKSIMTLFHKLKGYLFAAIAAASYGTNPIFAIPLYGEGVDVTSVLFLRYATAVLMMGIPLWLHNRHQLRVTAGEGLRLFGMGLLMVLSSILLFEAYRYLSAGIASTLLFFYPVMVALIMAACYHEKLSARSWTCLFLAFTGVALLSLGDDGHIISLIGLTLVMLSSLSYAIYLVWINRGPMRHLAPSTVTLYVLMSGLLVLSVLTVVQGGLTLPCSAGGWANALTLGLFPTIISLYFTSQAIAAVGSTTTAIFGALEPLTAVLLGMLVLGETLTLRPAVGMAVIFVSVTLLMMRKRTT